MKLTKILREIKISNNRRDTLYALLKQYLGLLQTKIINQDTQNLFNKIRFSDINYMLPNNDIVRVTRDELDKVEEDKIEVIIDKLEIMNSFMEKQENANYEPSDYENFDDEEDI